MSKKAQKYPHMETASNFFSWSKKNDLGNPRPHLKQFIFGCFIHLENNDLAFDFIKNFQKAYPTWEKVYGDIFKQFLSKLKNKANFEIWNTPTKNAALYLGMEPKYTKLSNKSRMLAKKISENCAKKITKNSKSREIANNCHYHICPSSWVTLRKRILFKSLISQIWCLFLN